MNEQEVIDWLADQYQTRIQETGALLARREMAVKAAELLYFATGHEFECRQVIPPGTQRPRDSRGGGRAWR